MSFRSVLCFCGLLVVSGASAELVALSSQIELEDTETLVTDYRLLQTRDQLLVVSRANNIVSYRQLNADGATVRSGQLDQRPDALAFNGSRLAVMGGNCDLSVIELSSGVVQEFEIPFAGDDSCFFPGELAWGGDEVLAVTVEAETRSASPGRPSMVIYSEAFTLDLATGLFSPVDLEPQVKRSAIRNASVSGGQESIAWSYRIVDGGSQTRLFSTTGEAIGGAFPFAAHLQHRAVHIGERVIQAGVIESGDRLLPAYRVHKLSDGTSGPQQLAVSSALSDSLPSLSSTLVSLKAFGTSARLSWELEDRGIPEFRLPAPLVLGPDAEPVRVDNLLAQSANSVALNDLGVEPTSVLRAQIDQTLWVLWRGADRLGLNLLPLQLNASSDEGELSLSIRGVCDEQLAWVEPRANFVTGEGFQVRVDGGAAVPENEASSLDGLYDIGTTFQLLNGRGQIVQSVTLTEERARPCNRGLRLEVVAEPEARGLGIVDVVWRGSLPPLEIRIGAPDGQLFVRTLSREGVQQTGLWVRDGMQFFLVNEFGWVRGIAIARFGGE